MTRQEIEQAITANLGLIRGVVRKTLSKYGAKLCDSDKEDIDSNAVLCLLDGRMDKYNHTTESKLQQWIGYIAMQRTIDYLRAIKKNSPISEDAGEDDTSKEVRLLTSTTHTPAAELIDNEFQLARRARLRDAVSSLSEPDQQAYAAMIQDDYSTRAYATQEGIKESSVHTRRHRLIRNLRKVV